MLGGLHVKVNLAFAKSSRALKNTGGGGATATAQAIAALQETVSAMAQEIDQLKEVSHEHLNQTTLDNLNTSVQGKLTLKGVDV
jgi:hypothetical protein